MSNVQNQVSDNKGNKSKAKNGEVEASQTKAVDQKKLWEAVKSATVEVDAQKLKLEAAVSKRSDAVQAIKEACGTGPFQVAGLGLVTIRHRPEKDEKGELTGRATYFFVTMGSKQVTVVE